MTVKEISRHEIAEAFDFVRFLMKHPKELKRIKSGSTVEILSREMPKRKKIQSQLHVGTSPHAHYLSEHTFQRI